MLNALALRCRDPGEFIASVVEHHRGFPLPRSEEEKTYLVFIGPQSEEDILEQIPGPGGELTPQGGGEEAGGREEGDTEEEHQVVYGEEEREGEREENGSQLFLVERWQPYRRIRIQYEVGESNEGTDGTHDVEEGYREYNSGGESSGDVNDYEEFLEQSSPSLGTPRGRLTGRRTTRSFGPRSGSAHESRSEGPNEPITEELARRFSRLPSNLGESGGVLDGVKGDENGGSRAVNRDGDVGPKSPSTSQELIEQFSQFIPFQKGNSGKPDDLCGNAEGKLYQTINDSQDDFDKTIQGDQGNGLDDLIGGREGVGFPTTNEEPPQTPHLLESVSQGRGSRSPMSSPLSSPPPESEEEIESRGAITEEEGQKGPSELSGDGKGRNYQTDSMDVVKELSKAIYKRREESVELHGAGVQERYQTAGEIPSQASPHRKFVLQVREPGSPVRPRPDEISPLTSPLYPPSLHDASEEPIKPGDEGFTEFNEDETPLYPIPTLENLIATEHIDIVYVPDLETLQAFLESVMLSPVTPALNPPLLAIWGLVSAHYETDYFGGEGIGYTIAQAVEAAAKSGRLLVLGEGFIEVDYGDGGEVQEQCWMDVEVPLLNMGSMIVGRTVEVERILRNWCRFGDDLEYDEEDEGGEEGDEEEKGYVKKGCEENERRNWDEEGEEGDEDEEDTEDGSDEEDDEDGGGDEDAESGENEEDEAGDESGEGEDGREKGGG